MDLRLLAEAARRGILPPQMMGLYQEAARRGLVPSVQPQQPQGYNAALNDAQQLNAHRNALDAFTDATANGFTFGLSDKAKAAINAGLTGAQNFGSQITGGAIPKKPYGMSDAYNAQLAAQRAFEGNHPIANTAGNIVGGAASLPSVAGQAYVAGASGLIPAIGRSAVVGGVQGGLSAAGNATGTPMQQAQQTGQGVLSGAATGAVIPTAMAPIGAAGNLASSVVQNVARRVGASAPSKTAAQFLADQLVRDGHDAASLLAAPDNFAGISTPSVLDLGGENTRAFVRNAAQSGPARNLAQDYQTGVRGGVKDAALQLTQNLAPYDGTALDLESALKQARETAATAEYRKPYNTPIQTAPIVDAFNGIAGRDAIGNARREADAMSLWPQVQELDQLKTASQLPPAPNPTALHTGDIPSQFMPSEMTGPGANAKIPLPPQMSLGSLDRTKIAFNTEGAGLMGANPPKAGAASGLFNRANMIDDYLASQNPDYANARDWYGARSQAIDALSHGQTGLTARPPQFAAGYDGLNPWSQYAASVGHRQALADAIGRPAENSTGVLNTIATSPNQSANLAVSFGPDAADAYQQGLSAELQRVKNADFVAPNSNSFTAGRAADKIEFSPHGIAKALMSVVTGPDLTDEEREAIVNMGTANSPNADLISALQKISNAKPFYLNAAAITPVASQETAQLSNGRP